MNFPMMEKFGKKGIYTGYDFIFSKNGKHASWRSSYVYCREIKEDPFEVVFDKISKVEKKCILLTEEVESFKI